MFSFWELIKWIGKTHKLKACFRSATLKTTIKQTGLHVSTKPGHTLSIFSFYVGYRWKIDGIDLRSTACHAHWGRKSVDIVNVGFGFLWRRFPLQVSRRKSMAAPGLLHKTIEMIMSNDGVTTRQSHFTPIKKQIWLICAVSSLIKRPFRINYLCQEKDLTKHVLVHMEISLFL